MPTDTETATPLADWIAAPGRERIARGPASTVVIREALPDGLARAAAAAMSGFDWEDVHALRADGDGLTQEGRHVDEATWNVAPPATRLFRFGRATAPSLARGTALAATSLLAALVGPTGRGVLEALSGEPLGFGSAEAHRMRPGDFIDWHSDDRANRRLVFVLHLSDGVPGGDLELETPDGGIARVAATFNTLVLFPVAGHRAHCVGPIRDGLRLSINGFYNAP